MTRSKQLRSVLASLLISGILGGPAWGAVPFQDESSDAVRVQEPPIDEGEEEPEEPAEDLEPLPMPATVEEALEVDPDDVEDALEGRGLEERQACLELWMGLVRLQEAAFLEARDAPEGSELFASASARGADRDEIVAITEIVLVSVAEAGGDVESEREELADIRESDAEEVETLSTMPADASEAKNLDLNVLRAQLRPLTLEQVEEQLDTWMALLRKKCLEVRKAEVAALDSEDVDSIERFNARAVELRAERDELIKRVRAVIDSMEKKGGDVEVPRAYVDSVLVAPLITGWRAAITTAKAWMTSPNGGLKMGQQLLMATLVLVATWFVARFLGGVTARALKNTRRVSGLLREFLVSSVRRVALALGVLVALGRLGFDMTPLLATIGATGLVIGLALQNTLSNFASGIMIMIYRPFDVGDVISVAGTLGTVRGLNLVTTRINTFDNQSIYIPNNKIWGDVITNVTANPTRRVDMVFGIAYGDDIQKAKQILLDVVEKHEKVLESPKPTIEVSELGDSSVNLICRPWARTADYWDVFWSLNHTVKDRFDAEGITIPFPQRDLHVHGGANGGEGWLQPRPPAARAEESRAGSKG